MSNVRSALITVAALTLGACGGGTAHVDSHESHERARVAEIDALHDELAPVYHAEAGATRAADACAHASALHDRSAAVQAAAPPAGVDGSHWRDETGELASAADALVAECGASGPAVEQRLEDLHARFHGVMELAYGGEHEHDGEHHDHEGEHHDGDGEHHDGEHHDGDGEHHDGEHHDGDGEHHDDDHDGDHH